MEQPVRLPLQMRQKEPQDGMKGEEGNVVRPEDMPAFELTPQIRQPSDDLRQRPFVRREEDCVDCTSRNASDDLEPQLREVTGDSPKESDLVRGPGAAAGEHDREVAVPVSAATQLLPF